ncbi:hypothetical protein Gotri_022952 [Gossypium trilobum]|uniref:Uncharacterized protein n=1 Tax=Gossypium trilobum TaxID=34281 RepID=A0A7J9DHQ9_9ROSI|nr:hypothetical protein [Gossypium trilobum]
MRFVLLHQVLSFLKDLLLFQSVFYTILY